MGSIKDRNGMDLTEAEDIKKRWQEYTEREGSIFMKTEARTLLSISLPKRSEGSSGTIRNLCENSTESQSQLTETLK